MSQQKANKQLETIHNLINELSGKDKGKREEAHRTLIRIGEPAVLPLAEALADKTLKDPGVRREIVRILAVMLDPCAAEVLVKQLESDDHDIRWAASEGLIALGYKGLDPLLNALIKHPESSGLQWGAHHVLDDLYTGSVHESESGYTPLYDPNDETRRELRQVVKAMDDMDRIILVPLAAKHALDVLKTTTK